MQCRDGLSEQHEHLPAFKTMSQCIIFEEDEQCSLAARLCHKTSIDGIARVIPHFHPRLDMLMFLSSMALLISLTRTHLKQHLPRESPLTVEHRGQCVAEEPLTLSRDGMRCLPSIFWQTNSWPCSLHFRADGGIKGRT